MCKRTECTMYKCILMNIGFNQGCVIAIAILPLYKFFVKVFFNILKQPLLAQKQIIHHMPALILSFIKTKRWIQFRFFGFWYCKLYNTIQFWLNVYSILRNKRSAWKILQKE